MEPDPILPKAASDDDHRLRRALARLTTATALAGPVLVLTAEAASARIAVNHNEVAGADRRGGIRRSVRRVATATAVLTAPVLLLTAEAASARIALNHNEAVGLDRAAPV